MVKIQLEKHNAKLLLLMLSGLQSNLIANEEELNNPFRASMMVGYMIEEILKQTQKWTNTTTNGMPKGET